MFSFDGLPRSKPDGQFMNTWSSNSILSSNFIPSAMPITQTPAEWAAQSQPLTTDFDDQSVNDCYGYSTLQNNATDGSFPRSMNYADVPRTWPSPYEPRMAYNDSVPPKTYKASSYMITPQQQPAQTSSASTPGLAYDAQESSRDFSRLSISQSPRMEDDTSPAVASFDGLPGFVMPSRESSSDSGSTSGDLTVADVEDHGAVEPYAKLIYRALMSKPDHSMVLQEIYQWFRDNTAKGSSDTKGWMNSIRHNLSMNAVRATQLIFGNTLTNRRPSKRRSEKYLGMNPGSLRNGCWRSLRLKMASNPQQDTVKERAIRNSLNPIILLLHDKAQDEKGAFAQAKRSSRGKGLETTGLIFDVPSKD